MTRVPGWAFEPDDIAFDFARSGGPGGQNVNKVNTKVELRLRLGRTRALTPAQKRRLSAGYPAHMTSDGDFLVVSDRFRSQLQNRRDAVARLLEMLTAIRHPPRPRVPTKPSRAQKEKRLSAKRRQSERKASRRSSSD